jgi:ubiquinol oxidase
MHPHTAAFAAASPLPRARPLTGTSQHRLCPLRASLSPSRTRAPAPPVPATEPTPPAEPVPALHPLLAAANRATVDGMCAAVDAVYGGEGMAWRRFYTLEVLARIPFFAYTCLLHLRETLGGPSDAATRRLRAHFEQADNEALHLAVMCVAGRPRWLDRFLASHLGLAYFLVSVCVFLASPAVAFNFNELIEIHAYDTYDKVRLQAARF